MAIFSQVLAHLLFVYLVVLEPLLGARFYGRLMRQLVGVPGARLRYYRMLIAWEWTWVLILALILIPVARPLAALGLRAPVYQQVVLGLLVGMGVGLGISVVAVALTPRLRKRFEGSLQRVAGLLPATHRERWLYAGVALTAGICEELVFRGFLFHYLQGWGLTIWPVVVLTGILFGIGHIYQGVAGAAQAGALGVAFGALYALSGSILPGMVIHALIDLRVLALWRPNARVEPVQG